MGRLGFLERLSHLFAAGSGKSATQDGGIYIKVKCDACGEVIQARINPTAELSQLDDGAGYFVRKVLVGQKCYRPIEVELRYRDVRGSEISREVHGGISVE